MNEMQLQNEQERGWREMSEAAEEIGAGERGPDRAAKWGADWMVLAIIGKVGEEAITVMALARTKAVGV